MRKSIYITPKQYGLIKESEWNFHFGTSHDMSPYKSDNKYQMIGRETGHFGSGTYFSTYKGSYDNRSERIDPLIAKGGNPQFIEMGDGVYRVDFDLYKNLYRVYSKKHGDILYTMMRNLNVFYNRVTNGSGTFSKDGQYDNAKYYQIIKRNAEALGLHCPSYYDLTRMAQNHEGIQSFSTLFMERNGFNGVNVSGVDFYDNTKHGSVIYDLSKVSDDIVSTSIKSTFTGFKDSPYDSTIVLDGFNDAVGESLNGDEGTWIYDLCDMPIDKALRVLKNYTDNGNVLDGYQVKNYLSLDLVKRYLRLLFVKRPMSRFDDPVYRAFIRDNGSKYYIEMIEKCNAFYWVNYKSSGYGEHETILTSLLSAFAWKIPWDATVAQEKELKREYYNKLMGYMERPLTDFEERYIKDYFEE